MNVDLGSQANCSESVYQVCGIHKDNVEEFKKILYEKLLFKYNLNFLKTHLDTICHIDGKYALDITEDTPDLEEICSAANKVGASFDCVSCCSNYIESDESMEEHLRIKKDENRDRDPA